MNKLAILLFLIPLLASAQISDHKRIFSDSLEYKNFNQGFLDSQEYFIGTGDFFIGVTGWYAYGVPNAVCYIVEPKDRRFMNPINPNVGYLYSDINYYNGYKYGATKKKRKRIMQGSLTPIGLLVGILGTLILLDN